MRRTLRRKARSIPADFDEEAVALVRQVAHATMTSPERILALRDAVRNVTRRGVQGAIVECGVWRGGSMMVAALTLQELGEERDLYGFDTFAGMTAPTDADVDFLGEAASVQLQAQSPKDSLVWARAGLAEVEANLESTGYDMSLIRLVAGAVEETIPMHAPERIALLRLDTDWYESTKHELEHLWHRLAVGGVLIIDDYGHWQGARRAVDEYLAALDAPPMLCRIDYTGRLAIKV